MEVFEIISGNLEDLCINGMAEENRSDFILSDFSLVLQIRLINKRLKTNADPFWECLTKAWKKQTIHEIKKMLNTFDPIRGRKKRIKKAREIMCYINTNGRYLVCTAPSFSKVVFERFKKFITFEKIDINNLFHSIFPSAPEMTKELEWEENFSSKPSDASF